MSKSHIELEDISDNESVGSHDSNATFISLHSDNISVGSNPETAINDASFSKASTPEVISSTQSTPKPDRKVLFSPEPPIIVFIAKDNNSKSEAIREAIVDRALGDIAQLFGDGTRHRRNSGGSQERQ